MNPIQKTSALICLTLLVFFGAAYVVIEWPAISAKIFTRHPVTANGQGQGNPFGTQGLLPSLVKELHPRYRIEAEFDANRGIINGRARIGFDNPRTPEIHLYLYDYAWNPIRIRSVTFGGKNVSFQRKGLVASFPNTSTAERVEVEVHFQSTVPRGPTRFGVDEGIWTLTNWYPMLGALNQQGKWYTPVQSPGYGDPFVYQFADYDVTFTSPARFAWVTSWGRGEPLKNGQQGKQTRRYQAKQILTFSLVGSPSYQIETMKVGKNTTVDIASTDGNNLQKLKSIAESAFATFNELYGELPYPYVAIAETGTNSVYAMEYSNLAIISKKLSANNQIDHWLPHEIAHLWWYNSVATLETKYGWLDEGLVELSVYEYVKRRHGQGMADTVLHEFTRDVEQLKKRYPRATMAKQLGQFASYYEFDWSWYSKSALLYHQLRKQIGEEKYRQFLKRVQSQYHGSVIGPEHLDQALGQVLKAKARYFVPNLGRSHSQPFLPLAAEYHVDTVLNGMAFYPSQPARLINQTVYLPLREVMERFGYQVTWSDGDILLTAGNKRIYLKANSGQAIANSQTVQLPEKWMEVDGHSMVPLSFFSDVLKYRVYYDAEQRIVQIIAPNQ